MNSLFVSQGRRGCQLCIGTGQCAACTGTGVNLNLGSSEPKCPKCHGSGNCPDCGGSGNSRIGPTITTLGLDK